MMYRKPLMGLTGIGLFLLAFFMLPVILNTAQICPISVAAQEDSPCMAQEATIEAQSTQIAVLESTLAILSLGPTATATRPGSFETPPPTVVNSRVQIARINGPGDVRVEAVEIRNTGGMIDLTGWTLSDAQGNIFTFPEQSVSAGAFLTVYSRAGRNLSTSLYWGREDAVWDPNDFAVLSDANGDVQSTLRVP